MRPCGATRAGTQAPPLPISIIFFHIIPYKQNNHLRTILPNDTNHPHAIHPNETRKHSIQHIGGGNASRTPAPILKIKKCVYRYDFGATVDDAIYFKASYFFGVTVASP